MSSPKKKKINVTENEKAIYGFLASNGPATAATINKALGTSIKPGSFTNAVKKGFIATEDEDAVIERAAQRTVKTYALVSTVEAEKAKYSDTEKAILGAITETPTTLADLAEAMGTKLVPGNISGLIKKGNVKIAGEAEVTYMAKSKVKVYKVGSVDPNTIA